VNISIYRGIKYLLIILVVICGVLLTNQFRLKNPPIKELMVMNNDNWPHFIFFRESENDNVWIQSLKSLIKIESYKQWEKIFKRAMGIMGKALNEEMAERMSRNPEWFSRFKKSNPHQIVLLHYNGRGMVPTFEGNRFFAGHWLYSAGCKILSDLPSESGTTYIKVENPELFNLEKGLKHKSTAEIGICRLDENGKPDWSKSEQVKLISKDIEKGIIKVKRGYAGTEPRQFHAKKAWIAPHIIRGPFSAGLVWKLNFSTHCPRDSLGRTASDILLDILHEKFKDGGILEYFDGIEFDAMWADLRDQFGEPDCNADGKSDYGFFNGVNTFRIGIHDFLRRFRNRMGDDFIIMADGTHPGHQRAVGIINGIESEGFPSGMDEAFVEWSWGLNRHLFWSEYGRNPIINFINLKCRHERLPSGEMKKPDIRHSRWRLICTAALLSDAMISVGRGPVVDTVKLKKTVGIWDELKKGIQNEYGWLGKPLEKPNYIAENQPDILNGIGSPANMELLEHLTGSDVKFNLEDTGIKISSKNGKSELKFYLEKVHTKGKNLFVSVKMLAKSMKEFETECMPRLLKISIPEKDYNLPEIPEFKNSPSKFNSIFNQEQKAYISEKEFNCRFYF
jgi:hypothetical protein